MTTKTKIKTNTNLSIFDLKPGKVYKATLEGKKVSRYFANLGGRLYRSEDDSTFFKRENFAEQNNGDGCGFAPAPTRFDEVGDIVNPTEADLSTKVRSLPGMKDGVIYESDYGSKYVRRADRLFHINSMGIEKEQSENFQLSNRRFYEANA